MDESNNTIYQVTNSNDNKFWFDPFFLLTLLMAKSLC